MKTKFSITSLVILSTFLYAGITFAGEQEKMVIKLKTNDFELAETDISNLAVGESETIVTESGKTIDLLRTTDGVEVYVDGELLDIPHAADMDAGAHEHGGMHKRVIIECEVTDESDIETECDDEMVFTGDGDFDMDALHEAGGDGHRVIKIHKSHGSDSDADVDVNVEKVVKKVVIKEKD